MIILVLVIINAIKRIEVLCNADSKTMKDSVMLISCW